MPELVRFHNVSKYYNLGTGRGSLPKLICNLAGRLQGRSSSLREEDGFWALRDVSFILKQGQVLGIIGANGAGKTTTLKILSHVTEPTLGQVSIRGRMSSLIELGAGFHPDLSGRENIYLNGAILGLRKHEITSLFDQIVAFAELEQFIDTPVKRYSSGMYARLGFAVAAHVSPEILLVDEVLSVGDFGFQAKCAERMKQLRAQGTAIIFVSHNMRSVHAICDTCLLLNSGRVEYLGAPAEAIDRYVSQVRGPRQVGQSSRSNVAKPIARVADILRVDLYDERGSPADKYRTGDTLVARIHYVAYQRINRPIFSVGFYRTDGVHACSNTSVGALEPDAIEGTGAIEIVVPDLPLVPHTYFVTASIAEPRSLRPYASEQLASFRIESGPELIDEHYGIFVARIQWKQLGDDTSQLCESAMSGLARES